MDSKTYLYFLFLFFPFLTIAQEEEQIIAEVMLVLDAQEQAWNNYDLEGFMEGYWKSERLVFVGRKGPSYGWEKTLENYKQGYPTPATMGQLHFDVLNIEIWDNTTVHMVGKFTLKREKDRPQGYFSILWRKIDGEWRIVSDHSSSGS